jgi:hypothetical protein
VTPTSTARRTASLEQDDSDYEDADPNEAAAGGAVMRLIQLYAARACFRVSSWLAMLEQRLLDGSGKSVPASPNDG